MKRPFSMVVIVLFFFYLSGCNKYPWDEFDYISLEDGIEITAYYGPYSEVTIPSEYKGYKVKSIGVGAFEKNKTLRVLKFSDGIEVIRHNAFEMCTNLHTVELSDTIQIIEDYAFASCDSLTTITITSSVSEISASVFAHTPIQNILIDKDNAYFSEYDDVLFSNNGTQLVWYPIGKEGEEYTVPDTVLQINDYAFYDAKFLTSVTINEGTEIINQYAFACCLNLNEIVFPSSLKLICDYAFLNTSWLNSQKNSFVIIQDRFLIAYTGNDSEIAIPEGIKCVSISNDVDISSPVKVLKISSTVEYVSPGFLTQYTWDSFRVDYRNEFLTVDNYALVNKKEMTLLRVPISHAVEEYVVPDYIKSIGIRAFSSCRIGKIVLPERIEKIEKCAFLSCGADSVILNDCKNLKIIGDSAFEGSYSITEIELPSRTQEIGERAFAMCPKLKKLSLPASVIYIGRDAFKDSEEINLFIENNLIAQNYAETFKIKYSMV